MNTALLIVGVMILLLVLAIGSEAYFRGQKYRPLSQSRPKKVSKLVAGQHATDTSLLQDVLEERARQSTAQTHKETRK